MSDSRVFIDSNIHLYLFAKDQKKKDFVSTLKNQNHCISTQVVNENVNVCLKKLHLSKEEAFAHGEYLFDNFLSSQIAKTTIQRAFYLNNKYHYSYWDSLILSAAIDNNCSLLYSEDMQHNHVIERTLTIINPFLDL